MVKKHKDHSEVSQEQEKTHPDSTAQAAELNTDNTAKDANENQESDADQSAPEQDPKELMIEELKKQNQELNDKYLRLFSDFDNFRKRTMKERIELSKTASADIIEAILPVVDDLDRAYQAAGQNPDVEAIKEGLSLIQNKIHATLRQKGLEAIPALGAEFDTDYHEAITHIPAPDPKDKGKVIDEVQKGYTLNGKVIRYAKVVVAN